MHPKFRRYIIVACQCYETKQTKQKQNKHTRNLQYIAICDNLAKTSGFAFHPTMAFVLTLKKGSVHIVYTICIIVYIYFAQDGGAFFIAWPEFWYEKKGCRAGILMSWKRETHCFLSDITAAIFLVAVFFFWWKHKYMYAYIWTLPLYIIIFECMCLISSDTHQTHISSTFFRNHNKKVKFHKKFYKKVRLLESQRRMSFQRYIHNWKLYLKKCCWR